MPQLLETGTPDTAEDEFSLGDLDLSALTVVSMHDPAALPVPRIDIAYASCCSCVWHQSQ